MNTNAKACFTLGQLVAKPGALAALTQAGQTEPLTFDEDYRPTLGCIPQLEN